MCCCCGGGCSSLFWISLSLWLIVQVVVVVVCVMIADVVVAVPSADVGSVVLSHLDVIAPVVVGKVAVLGVVVVARCLRL